MIDTSSRPQHKTFGIAFALATAMCFLMGVTMVWYQYRVKSWPVVDGRVLRTYIAESYSSDSDTGRSTLMHSPIVEYAYQVDGIEYTNDQIWTMSYSTSDRDSARKDLKEYSKGKNVEVRYNSTSPEDSCLKADISWLTLIPFGIGTVFLIPSSIMLYLAYR